MALNEDGLAPVAVNNVGGGNVEGTGVGPNGEPGVYLKKRKLYSPVIARVEKRYKGFKEFTNADKRPKF